MFKLRKYHLLEIATEVIKGHSSFWILYGVFRSILSTVEVLSTVDSIQIGIHKDKQSAIYRR